jgi:hypothetical protein
MFIEASDEEEAKKGAFKGLSKKGRIGKIIKLWKTVYNKLGAVVVFNRLQKMTTVKISLFGR